MKQQNTAFLLLLRNNGYNQTALAQAMGLTVACVSKWVTGKSVPSVENAQKIADNLHLPVSKVNEAFFGGVQ